MIRYLLMTAWLLFAAYANAQPVTYQCIIYTQLRGAPESSVFTFEVNGTQATLAYTYRASLDAVPQHFMIPLDVLNNSGRSLVLGALTEGDDVRAPRYDVWVLDKRTMHLSSEVTRATDTHIGRLEQRAGTCIMED